jgi:hypothetical protein
MLLCTRGRPFDTSVLMSTVMPVGPGPAMAGGRIHVTYSTARAG